MYLINYILPLSGSLSFFMIKDNLQHDELIFLESLDFYRKKGLSPEINLFNEEIAITIDSNHISIISLFIKYSIFATDYKVGKRVNLFEKSLTKIVGDKVFYRVDQSLIENYASEVIEDEFWYRKNIFNIFSDWIEKQEELHWCKIVPKPYNFQPANRLEWRNNPLNPKKINENS